MDGRHSILGRLCNIRYDTFYTRGTSGRVFCTLRDLCMQNVVNVNARLKHSHLRTGRGGLAYRRIVKQMTFEYPA